MRYLIPFVFLGLVNSLYADQPQTKAIRKYENEVEVLRRQGQAAIKRLEGVFEKEVEKLRAKTLEDLQKELDAALEAKDLDKAVVLRESIKAFENAEASGLSAKANGSGQQRIKKLIPKEAVHFGGHRYLIVTEKVTWHQARNLASQAGGHLLRINSKAEQAFLHDLITRNNSLRETVVFIDGTREVDLKRFLFSDGAPVDFSKMLTKKFHGDGEVCLMLYLYADGKLLVNDAAGWVPAAYVIEWDN